MAMPARCMATLARAVSTRALTLTLVTKQGIITYRSFLHDAADLVLSHGGSLSGEHGDGQSRGELLPKMFGPELMQAFRELKRIWDPEWKMNPGRSSMPTTPTKTCVSALIATRHSGPPISAILAMTTAAFPMPSCAAWVLGNAAGSTSAPCAELSRDTREMHSTRGRAPCSRDVAG